MKGLFQYLNLRLSKKTLLLQNLQIVKDCSLTFLLSQSLLTILQGYINGQDYSFRKCFYCCWKYYKWHYFKNSFLTQIYPFYVNKIGVHAKAMSSSITFPFLSPTKQREILLLQTSSIFNKLILYCNAPNAYITLFIYFDHCPD